ncbi:MAG: aminoglycoside phosphotransferase family protein [Nanoarchaeota archaeon]|nr:aminoglycoside phosphotransferase family protein [Nanoarchaeota archaeon]
MFSKSDVLDYLKRHLNLTEPLAVSFVDIGNINYVYRVVSGKDEYYVKSSSGQERKKTVFTDHFSLRSERLAKEVGFMQLLRKSLPDYSSSFPEVVHYSPEEKVVVMSDVATGKVLLKDDLEQGVISVELMGELGRFLAKHHAVRVDFEDDVFFKPLLAFRTTLSSGKVDILVQKEIKRMYELIVAEDSGFFLSGDFSPKNIFYYGKSLSICDLEFCCLGDRWYDVGFFLCHLHLLKVFRSFDVEAAIASFLEGYHSVFEEELDTKRIDFYIGTGMLNRIDGVSRESYMKDDLLEDARAHACSLIVSKGK